MMTPLQFALALRMTESDDDPRAFGDAGLAITSYQVHPCWLWDQIKRFELRPGLSESWDEWIQVYVLAFYAAAAGDGAPVNEAMHFHLGHPAKVTDPDWDIEYSARFLLSSASVTGNNYAG